jgi:predicted metal-binding membrane protein
MAALFAVGVMSVGWMALIAAFIAAEKLLPWPIVARHAVAPGEVRRVDVRLTRLQ